MTSHPLLEALLAHAGERPRQPALISTTGVVTYGELADAVARCRHSFAGVLAEPKCLVGISISDEVQHLIASLGLVAAGISQITLATHETSSARAELVERAEVTHVLSDEPRFKVPGVEFLEWSEAGRLTRASPDSPISRTRAPQFLLNTSGTSGGVNLVAFTEQQIAQQASQYAEYADEVLLRLATVEYNTSKRHRLYCLWNGGTNVFRPKGSLANAISFAASHKFTCLDVSRMHLAEILAVENSHLLRDVKLRPGGAAVPALLRRRILDEVTPHLYVRYAATECGAIAMAHPRDHDDEATCGVPLAGVDLEIVADDGAAMPVGKIGEIRLRAPGMAAGYLRDPAKTAQRFRGGWFYPGDIGYLRKDGQLVVVGRKDDMINLNGINIFPAEIERVLEQHPDIVAAAIVSLESSVHGQVPIAAVELRSGSTTTPTQILGFARERLALRAPRRIAIVENMPRNEQGKILKSGVRSLVFPDKRR